MSIVSSALLLLLVMDPLGNIPAFLSALKDVAPARQPRIVIRELLIALAIMIVFLFAGQVVLGLFHISESALTIAGGVILFLIALRMVFPSADRASEDITGEPFIVPLAIPFVAGPSLLATELLLMSREPERWRDWLLALAGAWLATAIILMLASRLRAFLSQKGLVAMERLMGMVLVAIAVQMFLSGIERWQTGQP
jgi:multiple antibiotic resistance protein